MDKTYRILILEDMPSDAELIEKEISKVLPHCVFERKWKEKDFLDALDVFKPDIILSDYNMPGFDGLSALKLAHNKAPDIPFIIVTGSLNEDTAVECMKAGAWDYVIKEFVKRLGQAVLSALEQARVKEGIIDAQKELVDSEERYRILFEDNLEVMMVLDADSGRIINANHAALQYYGYTVEQMKTMYIHEINTLPEEMVDAALITARQKERFHFQFKHRLSNGQVRDVEVSSSRIQFSGKPYLHSIIHDVTEKKRLELELLAAKEKAEENDRLKTAFLHNISHEIRTPLNAIVGFSSFLSDPALTQEKRKEFVDIINLSSEQLLSIIADIIKVATLEAGQERVNKKETDINHILTSVHEQFNIKSLFPGISLEINSNINDPHALVMTDSVKLMQILTNLVSNALKFTRKGKVEFGCSLNRNDLLFYVEDTGIGIAADMHDKIFERFRQVDSSVTREFGGTGLGLSISKAYVELMGGRMWIKSAPGEGSTFYFTVPYEPLVTGNENNMKEANSSAITGQTTKTILVAEDEINNFLLIGQLLSEGKPNIMHAENGLQAVEMCRKNPSIELVLMDIKMPVMDGIEATRIIKSLRPTLPVVAITAYAMDTDKIRILEAGCNDYLSKPIRKEEFVRTLNKYL